jgi:hypothetical protein
MRSIRNANTRALIGQQLRSPIDSGYLPRVTSGVRPLWAGWNSKRVDGRLAPQLALSLFHFCSKDGIVAGQSDPSVRLDWGRAAASTAPSHLGHRSRRIPMVAVLARRGPRCAPAEGGARTGQRSAPQRPVLSARLKVLTSQPVLCQMARKPEPPKPIRWSIYKIAAKGIRLGTVKASDAATAIDKPAAELKVPANRLLAIRR